MSQWTNWIKKNKVTTMVTVVGVAGTGVLWLTGHTYLASMGLAALAVGYVVRGFLHPEQLELRGDLHLIRPAGQDQVDTELPCVLVLPSGERRPMAVVRLGWQDLLLLLVRHVGPTLQPPPVRLLSRSPGGTGTPTTRTATALRYIIEALETLGPQFYLKDVVVVVPRVNPDKIVAVRAAPSPKNGKGRKR